MTEQTGLIMFKNKMNGFDKEQVIEYITKLNDDFEALKKENYMLSAQINDLTDLSSAMPESPAAEPVKEEKPPVVPAAPAVVIPAPAVQVNNAELSSLRAELKTAEEEAAKLKKELQEAHAEKINVAMKYESLRQVSLALSKKYEDTKAENDLLTNIKTHAAEIKKLLIQVKNNSQTSDDENLRIVMARVEKTLEAFDNLET